MKYTIPTGSFAGTEVPLHQLVQAPDGNALLWPVAERYPLFRALFPVEDGWSLTTSRETLPERMPAYDEFNHPYRNGEEILLFPTMLITATLNDPNGRVVADATTLVELGTRKAYEMGENNARSRLFESLGLPAAYDPRLFTAGATEHFAGNVTALNGAVTATGTRAPKPVAPVVMGTIAVEQASFTPPAEVTAAAAQVVVTEIVGAEPPAPVTLPARAPMTPKAMPNSGLSASAISRAQQAAARAGQPFKLHQFSSNAELMAFAAKMGEEARKVAKAAEAGAA